MFVQPPEGTSSGRMDSKKKSGHWPLSELNAIPGGRYDILWWFCVRWLESIQIIEKIVVTGITMATSARIHSSRFSNTWLRFDLLMARSLVFQ